MSHGFLVALFVGGNRLHGVSFREIHIADGVIHLIQIFLIIIIACHSSQLTELLLTALGHHLSLGDAGIKLHLIGGMVPDHVLIGIVGFLTMSELCLYLSHQIPFSGTLHTALLMSDHLPQIGHGLLVVALGDVVVGIGVVPVLHGPEVHRVTAHITDHVFCIIHPSQFRIALGKPGSGQSVLHRLCVVEPCHIGEGGGGFLEGPLLELRLTQQQPGSPEEGVILPAPQPLTVFGGLPAVFVPFWFGLDTVSADGLFAFLDGTVVLTLTDLSALTLGHRVEGQHLREVVLMAFLFLKVSLYEGL